MPKSEDPDYKDLIQEIEEVWDQLQRKLPPEERRIIEDEPGPSVGEQLRLFEKSHTITFDAKEVEALVENAQQALQPTDAHSAVDGWTVDRHSALDLLKGFPTLGLSEGYTLITFVYAQGGNGHGETWAVPTAAVAGLEACISSAPSQTPLGHRSAEGGPAPGYRMPRPTPEGGIREFMTKVTGDGTPWSYVSASFFAREAEEIGARWHGAGWSWHRLMGTADTQAIAAEVELAANRKAGIGQDDRALIGSGLGWETYADDPPPTRYEIGVTVTGPFIDVSFYTFVSLGQERIEHHRDRFTRGSYEFSTTTTTCAVGPGFIVT